MDGKLDEQACIDTCERMWKQTRGVNGAEMLQVTMMLIAAFLEGVKDVEGRETASKLIAEFAIDYGRGYGQVH